MQGRGGSGPVLDEARADALIEVLGQCRAVLADPGPR